MRLFLLLALALTGSVAAAGQDSVLHGSIDYFIRNDSVVYDCQAVIMKFRPDTVYFGWYSGGMWPKVFLIPVDNTLHGDEFTSVDYDSVTGETSVQGRFVVSLDEYGVPGTGWLCASADTVPQVCAGQKLGDGDLLWTGLIFLPAWGGAYYDVDRGPGYRRTGYAASFEYGVAVRSGSTRIGFLTNPIHNLSKSDRFRFGPDAAFYWTQYSGQRRFWRPAFTAGVLHNVLVVNGESAELKQSRWGGMFGVGVEGPFEQLYYSYSSPYGGYHTVGVDFLRKRFGHSTWGTKYELSVGDGLTFFRIQAFMENSFVGDGDEETLRRPEPRPFWHKALSLGAMLPFLPIYALFEFL